MGGGFSLFQGAFAGLRNGAQGINPEYGLEAGVKFTF